MMNIKHYKIAAEKLLLSGEQCYKFTCVSYPDVVKATERKIWDNKLDNTRLQTFPNWKRRHLIKEPGFR